MYKTKKVIIGYSGHAYSVCDALISNACSIHGYFDIEEKNKNPYNLKYLGKEYDKESLEILNNSNWFVAIGNNQLREKITNRLLDLGVKQPIVLKHSSSILSGKIEIGFGVLFSAGCIVNPMAKIMHGAICNTGSIVEHECTIGEYSHIAPGAVLAGNVKIGSRSFIGANAVIKEGVTIGHDVKVGAGSVIIRDIPNNKIVVGNPGRTIK